ncbi:MAG: histone deacetylase [Candidatus Shapirobacteria bacterium]|nr:histone deacetylase [Candidatus Shapirobacteria bacterium]
MKELDLVYSDNYLKYDLGADNPISRTKTGEFFQKLKNQSEIKYRIHEAPKATDQDILLAHTPGYLSEVKWSARNRIELDPDTPVDENTLEGSYYIIGGTISCLNMALDGKKVVNVIGGMHHSGSSKGAGFCVFNDHAIAIKKLQSEGKIKSATVIDVDVHAGNGTQEIFYRDPNVLTISIHQDPRTQYPGTGFEWETGSEAGVGMNVNITLPPGTTEEKYLEALDKGITRAKKQSSDITVLVLGVDTYKEDGLGNLRLEVESFKKMGERFKDFKNLAVLFGGGYSRKIPDLWMSFLNGYLE